MNLFHLSIVALRLIWAVFIALQALCVYAVILWAHFDIVFISSQI